jgi:hypothetical protein
MPHQIGAVTDPANVRYRPLADIDLCSAYESPEGKPWFWPVREIDI